MPRRVGFSDEKSMPLAHVTLAPIMGLNNHDEGTSTDPARVHRPARPRGHTASLPPCWTPVSSQPVVPTSGKVSPLSSQGWMYPEPQSEREDLIYHEHKPLSKTTPPSERDAVEERVEKGAVSRHADNPLDIAVTRLADLERNVERRYLRNPLGTTIQDRKSTRLNSSH